jgi:hypothetical protein
MNEKPANQADRLSSPVMDRVLNSRLLFGVVATLYLLAFPYHPHLRSPNELCRLWQSRALIDHGTLSINQTMREFGGVGDLSVVDQRLPPFNSRPQANPQEPLYYPSKAPLLAFAAAPVYAVLKQFGPVSDTAQVYWSRLFLTILPALLLLVFLRRFLRNFLPPLIVDCIVATYAIGTMAFNYSQMFLSHQLTAVLIFMAFYVSWQILEGRRTHSSWILAGALAGAVVATEYTGTLGVLCLTLYVAYSTLAKPGPMRAKLLEVARIGALVLLGAAPFLGALMAYHNACFGHPLTSGYKYLNDPDYQPWHLGGFLGIRYPDPSAFALSFFSPLRGLFTLSPFLLLAFGGMRRLWAEHRALFVFTTALLLGNAYFTASFTYDSWGWSVGPRHMTPMLPFLLLPLGFALQRLSEAQSRKGKILFAIAIGACMSSVLVDGTLTFVNYVPPSHSTSLFGLAWPLFREGFLPPTVLLFAGIANPVSGILALSLVALGAALIGLRLGWGKLPAVGAVALLTIGAHFAILSALTQHHEADVANVEFMKRVWIAPPGRSLRE